MSEPATISALDRLDRAISRLEGAASNAGGSGTEAQAALALLETRHALLRDRIQQTIGDLDRLIAAEGERA